MRLAGLLAGAGAPPRVRPAQPRSALPEPRHGRWRASARSGRLPTRFPASKPSPDAAQEGREGPHAPAAFHARAQDGSETALGLPTAARRPPAAHSAPRCPQPPLCQQETNGKPTAARLPHCSPLSVPQPTEIYVDDEGKLTLHGLVQHYIMLHEEEKNRKLTDLLDALEFNQVRGTVNRNTLPACTVITTF